MIEQLVWRREPAVVSHRVDDRERARAELGLVAAAEREVLAVGDLLPHESLGVDEAAVIVPALAVVEAARRRDGDPVVRSVARRQSLREAERRRVDLLGHTDRDQPGRVEEAAEADAEPRMSVEVALVVPRCGQPLGRQPAEADAAILGKAHVEASIRHHAKAQAASGAELNRAHPARVPVFEEYELGAARLREAADAPHQLAPGEVSVAKSRHAVSAASCSRVRRRRSSTSVSRRTTT